jgi:aminopeptidase N
MTALTQDEAAARAALLTDVTVKWWLDLTDPDQARTTTRLRFACRRPGASTFVDAGFAVTAARLNDRPLAIADGSGRIALPGLAAENVLEVEGRVAFRRDGQGLHRFTDPVDGRVYLHTKFQPFDAHHVLACFDQPDIKAALTLTVVAPADWQVVGNTRVTAQSAVAGGATVRSFAPTAPLPPYLMAIVAGPYASERRTVDGLDIGLHTRPGLREHLDVDELVELTRVGRRYYESLFGIPYPFGDHYDIAFVPEYGFGAMEHPGCVTAHERFVFRSPPTAEQRRRRSEVLLHEMAHMWFGNLVTLRWWDDLWLNESFATLLAALSQSEATATGADTWAVFAADAKIRARDADRLPTTHPVHGVVPDTDKVRSTFDAITYRKGAALLRQRLHETGRERFVGGLSRFLVTHAHGNATAAQLHDALGPAGGRGAAEWAADWLGTTGAPELRVDRAGADRWRLTLALPAGRATPPIDVTVARVRRCGDRTVIDEPERVRLAAGEPTELPAGPDDLALVPNADDGHYATVVPDRATLDALADANGYLDDPVLRAVVWGALWEAVIDARLPVARYIDAVVAYGAAEAVPGVRQVVVERAVEGVWHFADPGPGVRATQAGPADAPRARLAAFAGDVLAGAPVGGDLHRLLAEALAAVAVEPAELDALRAAEEAYAGLGLLDLRWQILAGRCRAGDADDRAVGELAAQDRSDVSRRGSLKAQASWPTVEAKARAWDRAMGEGISLAERQAVLEGWAAPGQGHLRRSVEPVFAAALTALERTAGAESALIMARTAFPQPPADPDDLVSSIGALVEGGGVSDAVRRALVEQVALVERRSRARTAPAS